LYSSVGSFSCPVFPIAFASTIWTFDYFFGHVPFLHIFVVIQSLKTEKRGVAGDFSKGDQIQTRSGADLKDSNLKRDKVIN